MLILRNQTTERGFRRLEFTDQFGELCSIQESSIIGNPTIWLGCGSNRMLLTQEMAKGLIPILKNFIQNGSLDAT